MTSTPHHHDYERAITAPAQVGGSQDGPELTDDQVAFLNQLFDLARHGDARLIEFIGQGIPANLADHKGDTFLILAAYSGQLALVESLLNVGADVNAQNQRGQSPLTCAVFRGDESLVRVLLAAGADPTAGVQNAVATAKAFGQEGMLEILQPQQAP